MEKVDTNAKTAPCILIQKVCLHSKISYKCLRCEIGTSLAVQWLGLCASTAGGAGSIPGWGTKIPHAVWYGQNKKEKPKCNKNSKRTYIKQRVNINTGNKNAFVC